MKLSLKTIFTQGRNQLWGRGAQGLPSFCLGPQLSLGPPLFIRPTKFVIEIEVIDLMARMVQDAVVQECQGSVVKWYSIKCDETRDSYNVVDM